MLKGNIHPWSRLNGLDKILLVRCFREDRLLQAVREAAKQIYCTVCSRRVIRTCWANKPQKNQGCEAGSGFLLDPEISQPDTGICSLNDLNSKINKMFQKILTKAKS